MHSKFIFNLNDSSPLLYGSFAIILAIVNKYSANEILNRLSSLTFMVALGLSVAATIRIGNQKGLSDYISLKRIAISIFLITILIEIISSKLVETNNVSNIPITNPTYTTFFATAFPYARFAKSVIKNVTG